MLKIFSRCSFHNTYLLMFGDGLLIVHIQVILKDSSFPLKDISIGIVSIIIIKLIHMSYVTCQNGVLEQRAA